jgi:hypothetical protein
VNALGGQIIKLSSTSENFLNPMDIVFDERILVDENGAPESPIPDKIDFVISMVELIVGNTGLTAPERSLIDRAAKKIYEQFMDKAPTLEKVVDNYIKENKIPYTTAKQILEKAEEKEKAHFNDLLDKELEEYSKKMPILSDLYEELRTYGKESERLTASLEMYVYGSQKYFNNRTNVNINNRVVCFDIKNIGTSLKKLGMLIVQETVWNKVSANRLNRKSTRYYIDEFHLLLKAEQTANYTVEIWKRFRKWYAIPCGITQNVKDFLSSEQVESIFENTDFYYLLNQASGDKNILREKLHLSVSQSEFITNANPGCGLICFGGLIIPFEDKFPDNTQIFKYLTTKPGQA